MLKKTIFLILIFFSIGINDLLPQIIIDSVSINNYPETKVNIYCFDKLNKPDFNLVQNDFEISKSGNQILPIKNFLNPLQQNINDNSILLLFDLATDIDNFNIYKLFTNTFVDLLNESNTELSLISFQKFPYINNYFTTSFNEIKDNINQLNIADLSDISESFAMQPGGAIDLIKNAKYNNKAIILLSDGNKVFDNSKIITLANSLGVPIYVVSVGKIVSKDVFGLIQNTSGDKIELIDPNNIKEKSLNLLAKIFKYKPIEITFDNTFSCENFNTIDIKNKKSNDISSFDISIADTNKPYLDISPAYLKFGGVLPGNTKTLPLDLTARKKDITITNFNITSSEFSIEGYNNEELFIPKDQTKTIFIKYSPTDSNLVFALIQITSDACFGKEIYMSAGFPNKAPKQNTIKITNPNGGETFIAGDTAQISWYGVLPNDIIQLQYSTNDMQTWDTLAENVSGLKYVWNVVPVYGDKNRVRIVQLWPNNIGQTLDFYHNYIVYSANFSKSDYENHIVTTAADGAVRLFKSFSGAVIREFKFTGREVDVHWANFSQDDKYICAAYSDGGIVIWNTNDGTINKEINAHQGQATCVNYNKDNTKLVSTGTDEFVKIWDAETGKLISSFNNGTKVWFCKFITNDTKILFCDNKGYAKVLDIATNNIEKFFLNPNYRFKVNNVEINQSETKIGISQNDGKATVFDYNTGQLLYTVSHENNTTINPVVNFISFGFDPTNSNLEQIITSSSDYTAQIWNAEDGNHLKTLAEHTNGVNMAVFNFDGSRILTASIDKTSKVWNLNKRDLQIDTSDYNFTIAKARLDYDTLHFSKTAVLEIRYKNFEKYITNPINGSFAINDIFISGTNADEFKILDKFEKYRIQPFESNNISLSFAPMNVGNREAFLNIVVPNDTIQIPIVGEGYEPGLQMVSNVIDFGKVDINDFKDTIVTMIAKNRTLNDLVIHSIQNIGAETETFQIVDMQDSIVLKSQEYLSLKLRFYSKEIGKKQSIFKIENRKTNDILQFLVFGEGVSIDTNTINISLNDGSANIGEEVYIPISFNISKENFNPEDKLSFEVTYNSKIAKLINDNITPEYIDSLSTVKLTYSLAELNNNKLLKFKIGLTDKNYADIKLKNLSITSDNKYIINSKNAKIRILNTCVDGKIENINNKILHFVIYPNPSSNILNIDFQNTQIDKINELIITDFNANIIKKFNINNNKTYNNYSIYINDLNTGTYFISVKSQNYIETKKFEVIK